MSKKWKRRKPYHKPVIKVVSISPVRIYNLSRHMSGRIAPLLFRNTQQCISLPLKHVPARVMDNIRANGEIGYD